VNPAVGGSSRPMTPRGRASLAGAGRRQLAARKRLELAILAASWASRELEESCGPHLESGAEPDTVGSRPDQSAHQGRKAGAAQGDDEDP
jgi:hypothetical protein